jgi:hypothetical protein
MAMDNKKILIVGSGEIPESLKQKIKDEGLDVEIISQNDADRLVGFRSKEVQQVLKIAPAPYIYNPPALSRRERRRKDRLKKH